MEQVVFAMLAGVFDPVTMILAAGLAFFWKGQRRWAIVITGGASALLYLMLMKSLAYALIGFLAGCLQMLLLIGIGMSFHHLFNRGRSHDSQSDLNAE